MTATPLHILRVPLARLEVDFDKKALHLIHGDSAVCCLCIKEVDELEAGACSVDLVL